MLCCVSGLVFAEPLFDFADHLGIPRAVLASRLDGLVAQPRRPALGEDPLAVLTVAERAADEEELSALVEPPGQYWTTRSALTWT